MLHFGPDLHEQHDDTMYHARLTAPMINARPDPNNMLFMEPMLTPRVMQSASALRATARQTSRYEWACLDEARLKRRAKSGAEAGTRTPMALRPLAPEASASANSATSACGDSRWPVFVREIKLAV
jgi:hypothetical protein